MVKHVQTRSKMVKNGQYIKKRSLYPPTITASIYLYTPGLLKNQTLNLLTWADSSTDTKTHRHKQKIKKKEEEKKEEKIIFHLSCVRCHVSCVACHLTPATTTTTAIDPSSANYKIVTDIKSLFFLAIYFKYLYIYLLIT